MADTLNELSDQDLTHRLFDIERQLVAARFRHSLGTLENTAELRVMRKNIARVRTEARRREKEQGLPKDSLIRAHRSSYSTDGASADVGGAERGGFLSGIVDKLSSAE